MIGLLFTIETEKEADGRWIAEVTEIPGALVYGVSSEDVIVKVQALALRVVAERVEHGERRRVLFGLNRKAATSKS